jgi:hypothetical protein
LNPDAQEEHILRCPKALLADESAEFEAQATRNAQSG